MSPPCPARAETPLPVPGAAAPAAGAECLCLQTQPLCCLEIAEVRKQSTHCPVTPEEEML